MAIGLLILSFVGLFVAIGPFFLTDPLRIDPASARLGPSHAHPFGTDEFGRDLLSRVAYGGRQSILLAVIAVLIALAGGLLLGTFGPYRGGTTDRIVVVVLDSMFSFPPIILALVVVVSLGSGLLTSGIAVGIGWIAYFGRLVRGQVLTIRQAGYIEAARSAGSRSPSILFRHLIPNTVGILIVVSAYALSGSILLGAGLGFLGLGVQPPTPEWGSILNTGRDFLSSDPWIAIFPGMFIVLTGLGANLLGDGVQDLLDPRGRRRAVR